VSSHPVFSLSDAFVDELAAVRPLEATHAGITGHDDRWGDLGPDGLAAEADVLRRTSSALASLVDTTERWSALAVRVLDDELATRLERHEHGDVLRDLAHVGGTVEAMREALELQEVDSAGGRAALLARLASLPEALEGWRTTVDTGRQRGQVVAARQVRSTVTQLREMADPDGPLGAVAARLVAADGGTADGVAIALAAVREATEATARWLETDYLPDAAVADGVGEDRYLRAARHQLGTDLDAAEAYAWGWERVRELTERAGGLVHQLGVADDLTGTVATLRADPTFAAPSPEAFREAMLARQHTALAALEGVHFDVPVGIREVDVRLAGGGALGAYYIGPSEDLTRPGTIWWSLAGEGPVPLFEEISTAYHEGFPGHHLQVGTQIALADRLSRAHRLLIWNPGYGEGWALYTEQLMDELGLFEHPAYELGHLTAQLLRATRVVVDLGLHLGFAIPRDAPWRPGGVWDFDTAVAAVRELAFLPRRYAESEVTRYLGWPAQAITYALGQRAILELRGQRRARDGDAFDLKAFHADVLGSGPVGLDLLRELVLDGAIR
jgi:uncharacterized protein (DUF885 family)